ncbi:hypothetical protein ASPNIDRAFT_129458, partial [Aspergillus niger ATCC 1015]
MASNVYCPFCGVILLPDPYWDDPGARPWYAQVRGIYSTNPAVGHIKATGVGIVRGRKTLHAPLDSNQVYGDVAPDDLDEWRLCEQSDSQWCFGFHESCWKLLILRLQHGRVESPSLTDVAIAEMVFYQLCCTPCLEGSIFHFGHDYAGAAQTHRIRGRIPPMDLGSHRYADPSVLADISMLPQSYWRSRFLLGQEADFVFPCLSETQDWFKLFFATRASLKAATPPLVNRKRIRDLLEPMASLVDLDSIFRHGPGGLDYFPAPMRGNDFTLVDIEAGPQLAKVLGYFSGTETCIDVPKNLFIKAFRVAFCAEGLMGIQLQYGNSASSCWLGDSHGPGMAQGTLQIPKRPSQYHLLADLDRFKIVSLGLTESTDAHQGSLHRSPSDVKDSLRAHSQLWAPHAPMYEGLFVSLLLPPEPPRAFEPLSNMDFGGPGGRYLMSLTRLDFHVTSYPHPLIGMGYHYADGNTNPGNYQTYASLKGIRRIQASAGISGWSRPPNGICGLKLEYYNHPSPAIVGQWMNELKDGFDISPDEELQSVTVWITPLGFSAESPGL